MVKITKKQIKDVKEGNISSKDLALKLLEKYSAVEVATDFVELCAFPTFVEVKEISEVKAEPIKITKEAFKDHFIIVDEKGDQVKRGRKKKEE